MRKLNAFTLIEMLLVITLIAMITGVGVMVLRKSADQARIDKAALEMQSVLQAAMAYETAIQAWPESSMGTALVTPSCTPSQSPDSSLQNFIASYLPNEPASVTTAAVQSSLGTNYCWAPSAVNPGTSTYNLNSPLFWVALQVPGGATAAACNFANRLAAKLPNALVMTDPTDITTTTCASPGAAPISTPYVRAEVPQPGTGGGSLPKGVTVIGVGYCDSNGVSTAVPSTATSCVHSGGGKTMNTFTVSFNCASSQTGYVVASASSYVSNTYSSLKGNLPVLLGVIDVTTNSCTHPSAGAQWSCLINGYAQGITDKSNEDWEPSVDIFNGLNGPYKIGINYTAICG